MRQSSDAGDDGRDGFTKEDDEQFTELVFRMVEGVRERGGNVKYLLVHPDDVHLLPSVEDMEIDALQVDPRMMVGAAAALEQPLRSDEEFEQLRRSLVGRKREVERQHALRQTLEQRARNGRWLN